jgi:APA family basic amino acid/polyamine antiporter
MTELDGVGGRLRRVLGLGDAVLLGLGSIIGTGVFVTLGLAARTAPDGLLAALVFAALLALANGMSSAQLAASHPVSGGTYEYGYRYLSPWLGFAAGWLFLCAKTASAATAALGIVLYGSQLLGYEAAAGPQWGAAGAVVVLTLLVLTGVRNSSRVNTVIVSVTLLGLSTFVVMGGIAIRYSEPAIFGAALRELLPGILSLRVLEAAALLFVAYTGYGRIATLGEEVLSPRRTVPRAIALTLLITLLLYCGVALVGMLAPAPGLADGASLAQIAQALAGRPLGVLVGIAAVTAMLGVLLNLILGLSRVVLAMGRRGDLPAVFAQVDTHGVAPRAAVLLVGGAVALLALFGSIRTAWTFSAFTVLVYYALTNLAALRLPATDRILPRWISWAGLAGCLGLAAFIPPPVVAVGCTVLAAGLLLRIGWKRFASRG